MKLFQINNEILNLDQLLYAEKENDMVYLYFPWTGRGNRGGDSLTTIRSFEGKDAKTLWDALELLTD